MDKALREKLIARAKEMVTNDDPSHDWNHITRVTQLVEKLAIAEGADLQVVIPSALFHDIVNYPKDDPRAAQSCDESAAVARQVLESIPEFSKEKIPRVEEAIVQHSFSKGIKPETIEAQVVQDADRLEATGAISIMRTFSSGGLMKRPFYYPDDPFREKNHFDTTGHAVDYALDLFYRRLLKVGDMMNTETAKKIAAGRTQFLHTFLDQLKTELEEYNLPR